MNCFNYLIIILKFYLLKYVTINHKKTKYFDLALKFQNEVYKISKNILDLDYLEVIQKDKLEFIRRQELIIKRDEKSAFEKSFIFCHIPLSDNAIPAASCIAK